MKYKTLQDKVRELNENIKVVGVSKEDLIKILNEHNIKVEGEKFSYIHEEADVVFKSISEHIRNLHDKGMKQSLIAKHLEIRPQFVSNVIRKYKEKLNEVEVSEKTE